MNTILGGSFSSRLNDILRERKGYTYGAGSGFLWRPIPGPFTAGAAVTLVSDVFEFSWRYQLPAIVTLVPAGVLGIGVIIRLIGRPATRGG